MTTVFESLSTFCMRAVSKAPKLYFRTGLFEGACHVRLSRLIEVSTPGLGSSVRAPRSFGLGASDVMGERS